MLLAAFTAPISIPRVHAASGEVCLGDPSTTQPSAPCPAVAPVFDGPKGQQIRIGVFISGSDGLFLFNIVLLANHTLLRPVGYDFTNTVLIGVVKVETECLLGILVTGNTCASTDSVDTFHLVAHSASGSNDTVAPTSGLLFTAIYNITDTSVAGRPASVGFQTGCSPTSVGPDVCVLIKNGLSTTPLAETVQTGAVFDNSASATMPFVVVSSSRTSFGPEFPGVSNTVNITATAKNSYPPAGVADLVTFTDTVSPGLTASFVNGITSCSTMGASCFVTLTLSATAAGNYSVAVYGTFTTVGASGGSDTLSSAVAISVQVTDFAFSVSPTTISFISGEIGLATATLSSLNGFSGDVKLSNGIVSPGLTINYNPNPVTLSAGGTLTSTIIFKASPPSTANYLATVKATSGTLSKVSKLLSIRVAAPVPDFYFVATPTSIGPMGEGVNGTSTVTVTYVNGFAGTVTLTTSPSSPSLVTHLDQTSLTSTQNVTLIVYALVAAAYTLDVTGTSGATVHSITIRVSVVDFNLTATPNVLGIGQSTSGISTILVTPLNGFASSVSLATNASPGLTAALSRSTISGSGSSILNVTAAPAMSPGRYNVNVTGIGGSLLHVAQVNVTVLANNFTMTPNPASIVARPNTKATSTITLSSVNGFQGTITLSAVAPSGVAASLSANSVTLSSGGSDISVLTVNATSIGTFYVNVTGVSGSLTNIIRLVLNVTLSDFTISASPSSLVLDAKASTTSTISVADIGGFSGNVTLSISHSPGLQATLNTMTIRGSGMAILTVSAAVAGNYNVNVTGTSTIGQLVHTAEVQVSVADFSVSSSSSSLGPVVVTVPASETITVTPLNGFIGTVTLVASVSPNAGLTCTLSLKSISLGSSQPSTLSCNSTEAMDYSVNITATSRSLSHSLSIHVVVVDFSPTISQNQITVAEGQSGPNTVTISSVNGFTGSIVLNATVVAPPKFAGKDIPKVSFGTPTVTLTSGGTVMATVTVSVDNLVLPNIFGVVVNASSGGRFQLIQFSLTVPVPRFSIVSSPASLTAGPGAGGSSTITITSEGGLSGPVTLFLSPMPGLECSLAPSNITVVVGGSANTILSCRGSIGSYNETITGNGTTPFGASITEYGYAGVIVADFSLASTPTGILVNSDQPGHAMLYVSWTGHYNGTVNLSLIPSSGLNASLSSASVTGTGSTSLTVVSSSGGTYSLIVRGTSGSVTHDVTLTVTVLSTTPSGTANIFGLDPTVFYSGIGALIAAFAAGLVLVTRRRKRSR